MSLWYFPMMNLVLLGIGIYLLSLRRQIVFEKNTKLIMFEKIDLFRRPTLRLRFDEVKRAEVALDLVQVGFTLMGKTDNEGYPIPAIRLVLHSGKTLLVERGKKNRVVELGEKISRVVDCPFSVAEAEA